MNKYKVHISRESWRHIETTVSARSKTEAKIIAEATAGNLEFPTEKEAIYKVESVVRI